MKGLKVGQKNSYKRVATKEIIELLADASGDYNPIHLDEKYAAESVFGKCIAHGLFCLGMISKIVGTDLPGEGTIFMDEKLKYMRPVYVGDEVEATVEILELSKNNDYATLGFECKNQKDQLLLAGTSKVKIL